MQGPFRALKKQGPKRIPLFLFCPYNEINKTCEESMKKMFLKLSVLLLVALWATTALSQQVSRITKEDLRTVLGDPGVFVIDVRTPQEWEGSDKKIVGAIRGDPLELRTWMSKFPKDKTLVFYCS